MRRIHLRNIVTWAAGKSVVGKGEGAQRFQTSRSESDVVRYVSAFSMCGGYVSDEPSPLSEKRARVIPSVGSASRVLLVTGDICNIT